MKNLHLFRLLFVSMIVTAFAAFTGCSDDDDVNFDIPTLEIKAESGADLEQGLVFDENGGDQSIQIITNGNWKISGADQEWLAVSPALEGRGNQTVKLGVAALNENEHGRNAELKISVSTVVYGKDKVVATKSIKISQTKGGEIISEELIYGNNFDKEIAQKVNDRWPFLDQSDAWKNQEGSGAETVTYEQKGCSVRTSGASGGYEGASGNNKVFFGSEFVIKDITLPEGKTNFSIKFGGNYFEYSSKDNHFDPAKFLVTLGNGTGWSESVTYKQIGGDETQRPNWVLFEAQFSLKEPIEKLSIKFNAKVSSCFSIDDVKLVEGVGGQEISFEGGSVDPEPQPEGDAIYKNDFDKADAVKGDKGWPYLDQSDVWMNHTGSGATGVTYASQSASVRQSGKLSGNYGGASARNKIFFGSTPATFEIEGIELPAGKRNFRLTFGGNYYNYNEKSNTFDVNKFPVVLGNGTALSSKIEYKKIAGDDSTDPYWTQFAADFTLPEGTTSLTIKFEALEASVFAIDDVVLTEGQGGQEISFEGGSVDPEPEPQPSGDAVYKNDFDKADAAQQGGKWPYLDQSDVWINHTGTGAANVTYESKSMSARQSGKLSGNYEGASARNKIFFGSLPAQFSIKGIELPAGKRNFRLTFGGNYYNYNSKSNAFDMAKFPIVLGNGTALSSKIEYKKIAGDDSVDPYWTQFAADFTLPEGTKTLTIMFEALEASVFAIDDIVLTEGQGGPQITFDGGSVDPEPQPGQSMTIAEVIAAGQNQQVTVEAQLIAKHERGFIIEDKTGKLYVYTPTEAKVGATVKVEGTTGAYNDMFQVSKATVTLVKEGTYTYPAAEKWTGAQIESYAHGKDYTITYIEYEGQLDITPNPKYPDSFYYNIILDGTTVKGSLVNPLAGVVDQALNGKKVSVKGYTIGAAGKTRDFFNTMAVEVKEAGGSTPEPQPGQSMTIAEVIATGQNQQVAVEGQIIGKHERGFVIEDKTGKLYVYTPTEAKVGDTVKVEGTTGAYNDMFQVSKATVTLVKEGTYTYPAAEKWTGAQIESYAHGKDYTITYIEYEGQLDITPNPKYPDSFYYNIILDGTTVKGSLVNPLAGVVDQALNGKKVSVKGYTIGASGKTRDFFNTLAVEVKEIGGGTPTPEPGKPVVEITSKFNTAENALQFTVECTSKNAENGKYVCEETAQIKEILASVGDMPLETVYDMIVEQLGRPMDAQALNGAGHVITRSNKTVGTMFTCIVAVSNAQGKTLQSAEAKFEGGSTPEPQPGQGKTLVVDMATLGGTDLDVTMLDQFAPLHIVCEQGVGNNAPKYYANGTSVRLYAENTMTISGAKITKIEFTYSGGRNDFEAPTEGSFSADNAVWTGASSNLVLKVMAHNASGKSGQARIAKMVVTYE